MNVARLKTRARRTLTRQLCSTLIFILVTGCGTGAGAELKSCTERLGGEILFVGEARCLATLPQEELSGYWVSGHEYSVFYAAKQDIKREPDARAAWLFLSRAAEGTVKEKLRAGEWQVFAIRFVGAKSTARGIYGPGPFEAGVLVARIIEIEEISDR
jgi:hypothetical protein